MLKEKGLLLVISGPSGVGKGTICKELVKRNANMNISVSATTRKCRPGEVEGVNYFFKTKEEFQQMVEKGEFLEYMKLFNNNYYGTPRGYVEQELKAGNDIVLEIDYHGAMNVKKAYPQAVLIFIVPPRIEELKARSRRPRQRDSRGSRGQTVHRYQRNYRRGKLRLCRRQRSDRKCGCHGGEYCQRREEQGQPQSGFHRQA